MILPTVYYVGHFLIYVGDEFSDPGTCDPFTFKGSDNVILTGLRCLYGTERDAGEQIERPIPIIVLGGNGMDMYDSARSMAMFLPPEVTWKVFSLSMPGSQYAGGRNVWTTPDEALMEAQALLIHVVAEHGPTLLFGWSLGSSLAAGVAAGAEVNMVRCLLLGNPFTSIRDVAMEWTHNLIYPYIYLFDQWPTVEWVQHVNKPTIIMSALADDIVPMHMHEKVYLHSASTEKVLIERMASHMEFEPFKDAAADKIRDWCMPPPSDVE